MFGSDRKKTREMFVDSWRKHKLGMTLEPLEKQIVSVVEEHPEYHKLIEDSDTAIEQDFTPDHGQMNPFLHMGMHLALREQVGTNRPAGIAAITRGLLLKHGDGHQVEHLMMDCLGEMLWTAQVNNTLPDEVAYLEALKNL